MQIYFSGYSLAELSYDGNTLFKRDSGLKVFRFSGNNFRLFRILSLILNMLRVNRKAR